MLQNKNGLSSDGKTHFFNNFILICYRKPVRRTWWDCLKTPTCALSMPSVSPSCQKTSSWHDESVASVLKRHSL